MFQDEPLTVDENVPFCCGFCTSTNPVDDLVGAQDDTFNDGDSAPGDDAGSDTTSLKSSILKYREENGRTYITCIQGWRLAQVLSVELRVQHPMSHAIPSNLMNINRNLNPGGRIEMSDIVYPLASDDESLTEDSAVFRCSELLLDIFTQNKASTNSALNYKDQLGKAGFVDGNIIKYRWPLSRWSKDPKHKQIASWTQNNTLDALAAFILAVSTRHLGKGGLSLTKDEVEVFLIEVRKDIENVNMHSYWPMGVVTCSQNITVC
ncbi:hypothetical protein FGRMN_6442 [Fusarium graminum]|nr:hypothetical protein FGRMN_6442 [Fusarium graminum]